ncbi:MAG TPA: DUF4349 domain-containing protein [Chitinophaga sp.]|uniref:DUF4349 domain-containing protein n=1 Tax=Chitinophaga sp. TaxID=1869181 RepID=UPI002BF6D25A|nr:DUF4349 domain-containing protein [Chitinophaga sp.]HVI43317.1 DUF4349 domain-containing protein [Chitinophaga sp.]
MNIPRFIIYAVTLGCLFSCGRSRSNTLALQEIKTQGEEKEVAAVGTTSPAAPAADQLRTDPHPATTPQKIIRNAHINFTVTDFDAARSRIAGIVSKAGGAVADETESRTSLEWRNQMEIRVPSAQFESCVENLTRGVYQLNEKRITSQDVTEEYVDLDARMKAREETEKRYLELLHQAKNVKEVLEVEGQLKEIRESVEAAKGRLQYIDHKVAYSTISLVYYQTFSHTAPQSSNFFARAWLSVKDGWNSLLELSLGIIGGWPFVVIIVFIIIFIRKIWRRRKTRSAAAAATAMNIQ